VSASAPPSASLRDQLQEAINAAQRHDHDGFNASAARAKATLQSYPSGAERNAAAEVVRVLDDIDRLWTYEFENKSGSFFDASSPMLPMLNAYPGYAKAMADNTLTVQGAKLYPARESRDFLAREAQSRMSRMAGGRAPAPSVTPPAKAIQAPATARATPKAAPPIKALPVVRLKTKPTVKAKTKAKAKPEPLPLPVPPPVVATATTAPPPPAPVPAPVPPTTTTTVAPAPTTTTASTTTEAPPPTLTTATETTATETTATTVPLPQTPAKASPFRNVILPIILIVVGVGVLIVLFRASS
jgi:hypothetical protein